MPNSQSTDLFAIDNILCSMVRLLQDLEKTRPEQKYDREDIIEKLRDCAHDVSSALEIYLTHYSNSTKEN